MDMQGLLMQNSFISGCPLYTSTAFDALWQPDHLGIHHLRSTSMQLSHVLRQPGYLGLHCLNALLQAPCRQ